jgi:hypothetical protein
MMLAAGAAGTARGAGKKARLIACPDAVSCENSRPTEMKLISL